MHTLPRRLSHCSLKQEPFEQGMEYVSILFSDGTRRDFCVKCWEDDQQKKEGAFWRGVVPIRRKKNATSVQQKQIERAFELFLKSSDPGERSLLALYLVRKRQLIRRTKTLYEREETGELFDVAALTLTQEEQKMLVGRVYDMVSETSLK